MYTIVGDIMRKCDSSSNIGNVVLYECICCVSSMHPNPKLLDAAADAISRFLKVCLLQLGMLLGFRLLLSLVHAFISAGQSGSHNLKYMGIDALGRFIKISPKIVGQHQLAVIDCLEVRNIIFANAFDINSI